MSPTSPTPPSDVTARYQQVAVIAPRHQLPIALVMGIIATESGNDIYAWRCEPSYRYLYDVAKHVAAVQSIDAAAARLPPKFFAGIPGESSLTEWLGQQSSWGAMQIMGAVARELGWEKPFPALCNPMDGIEYGCRHLARLRDQFFREFGWRGVAASYNAGSPRYVDGTRKFVNQDYVDKVDANRGFEGLP